MDSQIIITKRSGEKEPFSEEKVLRSMQRVGLPKDYQPQVLDHIKKKLHPGITTSEIFSHITEFLGESNQKASIRYNLKQAIFELGPTGFPFERYMERIFQSQGYETRVDVTLQGECVRHEVDIVLDKNKVREIVEVKFHNQQGIKSDIQVALYTYARFLDIKTHNEISKIWLVTNTKLSEDAIVYCSCKGIETIAWNYPGEGNLQDFVEKPELYPVTILRSLTTEEKQNLLLGNIILCCDLLETSDQILLNEYRIPKDRLEKAKEAARIICNSHETHSQ